MIHEVDTKYWDKPIPNGSTVMHVLTIQDVKEAIETIQKRHDEQPSLQEVHRAVIGELDNLLRDLGLI